MLAKVRMSIGRIGIFKVILVQVDIRDIVEQMIGGKHRGNELTCSRPVCQSPGTLMLITGSIG